jgi:catechol 2,3-dioxygenase-like lactoylglutathione lyase family enzyme
MAGGIDHLVLAARDLDAQAALFRALGFTVGARNRHPWGTLNHIVQFPGCFLELITTEPGFIRPATDSAVGQFALPIADRLAAGDGISQLVLESNDAGADQSAFAAQGIAGRETFFFERRGKRPDGSEVHVAFTLAFAHAAAIPGCGFFVCQQHFPENFWNPAFQQHPNGVRGIAAVVIVADDISKAASFLRAFTGRDGGENGTGTVAFATPRGRIEVMSQAAAGAAFGTGNLPTGSIGAHFAAIRFSASEPARAASLARAAGVDCADRSGVVVVPAHAAHGIALAFAT